MLSCCYNLHYIAVVTGTAVDGADLKLAFAALTTALFEAAKLDKDELSLRYIVYLQLLCMYAAFVSGLTVPAKRNLFSPFSRLIGWIKKGEASG